MNIDHIKQAEVEASAAFDQAKADKKSKKTHRKYLKGIRDGLRLALVKLNSSPL